MVTHSDSADNPKGRLTQQDRIERLRQDPDFRALVEDLRRQTPEQVARMDRDLLDGELSAIRKEENGGKDTQGTEGSLYAGTDLAQEGRQD